jgi:hypothetical protein
MEHKDKMRINFIRISKSVFFAKKNYMGLKFLSIALTLIQVTGCEERSKYLRPNLPEKLCAITIIDADDTTNFSFSFLGLFDMRNSLRYFSLEKSRQSEYYEELNDSLQEFSYSISSSEKELFKFENYEKREKLFYMELPDNLEFISGEKYFLYAREKTMESISAETMVPDPPPILNLVSLERKEYERNSGYLFIGGDWGNKYYSAEVKVSFKKSLNKKLYYALFIDAKGNVLPDLWFNYPNGIYYGQTDFSVRESNVPYFISDLQGINMIHVNPVIINDEGDIGFTKDLAYALFINSSQIPGDECIISVSIPFGDMHAPISTLKSFRIKLLSITEQFYLFEKSLYTYNRNKYDPFAEPIYLNGNIKGGNGIFTICRSIVLELYPDWHYDE